MVMGNSIHYMELRGSMTQFLPITEDWIIQHTQDGLIYNELAATLSGAGLSIEHVVYDPSRKIHHTFYADYDAGYYAELYLDRHFMDVAIKSSLPALTQESPMRRLLRQQRWKRYYHQDVPVPLLIYDFQRRYREIADDEIFDVWYSIHKRIDFSNGMWDDAVLHYIFDRAPAPTGLPAPDSDGKLTLYRGMGDLSLPPEQAISWSTDPINALWFANHSGRGTKLLVGRVAPDQVVAYYGQFPDENEVILRPGTVRDVQQENMIPADAQHVPQLLAPCLTEFLLHGQSARKLGYPVEELMQVHGICHVLRTLLLTLIYCHNSGDTVAESDKHILIYFSLLHDIGRDSEYVDDVHGDKSVDLIRTRGIRLRGLSLTQQEHRIAQYLIRYHCRDDSLGIAAIAAEPRFSKKEQKRAIRLYQIAKDMDGLDRVRFNGLDYRMLRTPYARKLPLVAGALLQEDLLSVLEPVTDANDA